MTARSVAVALVGGLVLTLSATSCSSSSSAGVHRPPPLTDHRQARSSRVPDLGNLGDLEPKSAARVLKSTPRSDHRVVLGSVRCVSAVPDRPVAFVATGRVDGRTVELIAIRDGAGTIAMLMDRGTCAVVMSVSTSVLR